MNLQAIVQELLVRAKSDAAFRLELEGDPDAVLLRETGMTVAELEHDLECLARAGQAGAAAGQGDGGLHPCPDCGRPFPSEQLLQVHCLFAFCPARRRG